MKLLSEASEYGLRAVVWLAQRDGGTYKLPQIAEGTKAAPGYLIKVLQMLARAGIVTTQRGSRGGFTLVREADELTILEVINAVDPIERIRQCPLGLKSHGKRLCPMHKGIDDAMEHIEATFGRLTVKDVMGTESESESIPLTEKVE